MILDIYKDSLEYSAQDWKRLVMLGIIAFFSFLFFPVFLITGYYYRVINTAVHGIINGRDSLPDFDNVVEMFVDGVKLVIVQIVYLIIPTLIFIVFLILATKASATLSYALLIIGSFIAFVVGILACLMSQMGICHMAYNDGAFSKAFAVKEIKKAIDEIGWFRCIVTYLGIVIIVVDISLVVTGLITLIFSVFGISGAILGLDATGIFVLCGIINYLVSMFIVGPYLSIFSCRSMGLLYTMQI